jgi:D-xylonolactonase
MFRFEPDTGKAELVYESGAQLGGLTVQQDGSLLQFLEEGNVQIWRQGRVETVCEGIDREAGNRFNDAATDLLGRVLAGTMPGKDGSARLYRFDHDGSPTLLLDGLGQSNGMEFARGGDALYHTDTKRKTIARYAYDQGTGEVSDPETLITVRDPNAVPDGLIVDDKGYLLSAQWGASRVARYDAEGREVGEFRLPTPQVASLAFGGGGYADLYVTTAGGNQRDRYGPGAGALFRFSGQVRGCGPTLSRVMI